MSELIDRVPRRTKDIEPLRRCGVVGENLPLALMTSSVLLLVSRGRDVESLGTSSVWRCCRR